jgi:hypothetical protein
MWILAALLVGASAVGSGVLLASSVRRLPVALLLPAGTALALGFEAIAVHLLSAAGALGRTGIIALHLLLVAGAAALAKWGRGPLRRPRLHGLLSPYRASPAAAVVVASLAVPVALSALEWAPNNWDAMTYRLARVAHWIQNGSVAAFVTSNARQNVLPPGSEYAVLVLNLVAGSDALANLVQLGSWLVLALSAPALARALGAPRRLAPWAGPLLATAPMAVLQAPTTQNDLVAALTALAAVVSTLPFLHARRRWRPADVAAVFAIGAVAALVKPSGAAVAAPFLAWGIASGLRTLRRSPRATAALARGGAAGAVLAAAILVPFLVVRAADPRADAAASAFVYPLGGEVADRLLNVARGLVRHLPLPAGVADAFAGSNATVVGCEIPGRLCTESLLRFHEDYAGNPGQALVALAALLLVCARWRAVPRRALLTLAAVVAGWVAFHLTFRDNIWISRLQLPLFAVGAVAVTAIGAALPRRRAWTAAAGAAMILLSAHGALTAARTEARPPLLEPRAIEAARSDAAYYATGPRGLGPVHDGVLWQLGTRGCRRLGLLIGGDSYDYPLTWRALRAGVEVRHLQGPDDWPCAVFSDQQNPLLAAWAPTEVPGLFVPR